MDQRWDADHEDAHACRVSVYIMTTHLPEDNGGEYVVIVHSLSTLCPLYSERVWILRVKPTSTIDGVQCRHSACGDYRDIAVPNIEWASLVLTIRTSWLFQPHDPATCMMQSNNMICHNWPPCPAVQPLVCFNWRWVLHSLHSTEYVVRILEPRGCNRHNDVAWWIWSSGNDALGMVLGRLPGGNWLGYCRIAILQRNTRRALCIL